MSEIPKILYWQNNKYQKLLWQQTFSKNAREKANKCFFRRAVVLNLLEI